MSTFETPFEYFDDPAQRAMIAEAGFRVAQYAKDEQIGSLVLVDRAARNFNIPVREAFRQIAPDEAVPGTYFLNPNGFTSPELHDIYDYIPAIVEDVAARAGMTEAEATRRVQANRTLLNEVVWQAEERRVRDYATRGRERIAQQLTPLLAKVIERDDTYNGSVLVLDACMHQGGSTRGILGALEDVGVPDVRLGIVNNIRNRTDMRPDFIVFNDDEIVDVCKPFGHQDGLTKGSGNSLTSLLAEGGISEDSRLARDELHAMMKDSTSLRQDFLDYARRNKEGRAGGFALELLDFIERLGFDEPATADDAYDQYTASDYVNTPVPTGIGAFFAKRLRRR